MGGWRKARSGGVARKKGHAVIRRFVSECYISHGMSVRNIYRGLPLYFALPIAFLASAIMAMALAVLGVFATEFLLNKFNGPDGPGGGVLVILIALNIAVPGFISLNSI
jgi:hypothetical protein